MQYYVYAHLHPATKIPFYIGKGTKTRSSERLSRSAAWKFFVRGLENKGLTYSIEIIHICENEAEALIKERIEIQACLNRGQLLFNQVIGDEIPNDRLLLVDTTFRTDTDQRDGELATFVRTHRKRAKLTQTEFADRAGVGIRFIRELENGKRTLQINSVNKVLHLFGHKLRPGPEIRDP